MSRAEQIEEKAVVNAEPRAAEPSIDQVRELLFGQTQRSNDKRAQELQQTIDALRQDMMERFAAMEARMEQASLDAALRHANAIDAIGAAIGDLGAHVRKLAETSGGK